MNFGAGVTWRVSRRGLVVCDGRSQWLLEHDRAADFPKLVVDAVDSAQLISLLGGADTDTILVSDLIEERILIGPDQPQESAALATRRITFTRSGAEFSGIAPVARMLHRAVMPVVTSWLGRAAVAAVIVGGIVALVMGRPPGPQVSQHPWVDATLGLAIGLGCAALHELGHAVALVHYGRTPRSAGVGFYWGALCFYVDSSDGITLPRRARIVNALSGLGVDAVTTAVLLIVAQLSTPVLIVAVCWRIAILGLVSMVESALPILEVDGHIALTDYLDEPDLSPRAREALGRRIRGIRRPETPTWLATYGVISLVGGIVLLIAGIWIWWLAAADLILALLGGGLVDILLGIYVVVPVLLGAILSAVGLVIDLVARPVS